jgi:hypothetical protein
MYNSIQLPPFVVSTLLTILKKLFSYSFPSAYPCIQLFDCAPEKRERAEFFMYEYSRYLSKDSSFLHRLLQRGLTTFHTQPTHVIPSCTKSLLYSASLSVPRQASGRLEDGTDVVSVRPARAAASARPLIPAGRTLAARVSLRPAAARPDRSAGHPGAAHASTPGRARAATT